MKEFFIGIEANEKSEKRLLLYKAKNSFYLSWETSVSNGLKKDAELNQSIFIDFSDNANQNRLIANAVLGFEFDSDKPAEIYPYGDVCSSNSLKLRLESLD